MDGDAALDARHHLVLDADVGEGAAHHHFVVAASCAVGVEVHRPHLMLDQILAGRAVALDRAGGRDVVGGDGIEEEAEDARADDVGQRLRRRLHVGEVGRVLHIGRAIGPAIGEAALDLDLSPVLVALEDVAVAGAEHLPRDHLADQLGDLRRGRPDVLQVDRLAVLAHAERLARDVDLERAGERVGDDQRRRGEIVRAHVRIDAALEVAVAGEHRAGDEVVRVDRLGDRLGQRPGIADAGRAAVADEVEAERVEMLLQPGLGEVLGHHLRARRERRLHPRLRLQPLLVRLLGEQPAPISTLGLEVLVHDVIAAMTTWPSAIS